MSNTFNKVAQGLICKLRGPGIKQGNGSVMWLEEGEEQALVIESVHQLLFYRYRTVMKNLEKLWHFKTVFSRPGILFTNQ